MKILAFDTANNNNDVVILDNKRIVASNNISDLSSQAESLIPSIEKCLNDANIWYQDLDLIASTKGPGNFTGVRIGFTVAKTIKMASNLDLITVNNLEAIAYDYLNNHEGSLLVVLDAKLDEFFIQEFFLENNSLKAVSLEPELIKYEEVIQHLPSNNFLLCGSGKQIAANLIKDKSRLKISQNDDIVKATNVALLAQEIFKNNKSDNLNEIMYVRKPKISKSKKK